MTAPRPLRLGIAGLGTVGMGVVGVLRRRAAEIALRAGRPVVLTAVSARDRESRPRRAARATTPGRTTPSGSRPGPTWTWWSS